MDTTIKSGLGSYLDKGKLFIKAVIIFIMALFLTIPSFFITGIINERQSRQNEAILNITEKWGGKQMITGPFLSVPYIEHALNVEGKPILIRGKAYFLPSSLHTAIKVVPEKRYRGIYQVVVYRAEVTMNGRFDALPWQQLKIPAEDILWNQASVIYKVSDNQRGVNEDVSLQWNDSSILFTPETAESSILTDGFTANVPMTTESVASAHPFSLKFDLNGSEQLLVATAARENELAISSAWKAPSFTGVKLPDYRSVTDSGFEARWKFLNRSIPPVWKNNSYSFETTALGADFKIPVDGYDKTMRAVKYAILCIILTFAAFFLIETIYRRPLHLVHYGLAGLALILFYTLLLSISEYSNFNVAYLVAGVATIGLVTWFIGSILRSGKLSLFVAFVLSVVYAYIFCIIQLEDYALLMGSIGLFMALGVIMYFSRKLSWS